MGLTGVIKAFKSKSLLRKEKHFKLEIRSMERGICPIAVFYFALKRSFFNI